jgi:hypothetical protein
VSNSNISIIFVGENRLRSTVSFWAPISCDDGGSIEFAGLAGALLVATSSAQNDAGIGTRSSCRRLKFLNGSYSVTSYGLGAAIGTYHATGTGASGPRNLGEIEIVDGFYNLAGSSSSTGSTGPAIGAGGTNGANNHTVDRIVIHGGTFVLYSKDGAGIGAGKSDTAVNSLVGEISIEGGDFSIRSSGGAGIGSGPVECSNCRAKSGVDRIHILNGTFAITNDGTAGGAAIGTGYATGATSFVDTIRIESGTFITATREGAGVGAGLATHKASAALTSVRNISIGGGNFDIQTTSGPGIGSGRTSGGDEVVNTASEVDNVEIFGGEFRIRARAFGGASIGSGYASTYSSTSVNRLRILGGTFDLLTLGSPGIGSGVGGTNSALNASSEVNVIEIVDGNFTISSQYGAAIGSGPVLAAGGRSRVGEISIKDGTYRLTTLNAPGIGSGYVVGKVQDKGFPLISSVGTLSIEDGDYVIRGNITNVDPFTQGVLNTRHDWLGAAGIGTGLVQVRGESTIETLDIRGGVFDIAAVGGASIGAGIALGENSPNNTFTPDASIATVNIAAGSFTLTGTEAGLGAGFAVLPLGRANVNTIAITAGEFTLGGAYGIGSTPTGNVSTLVIGTSPTSRIGVSATISAQSVFGAVELKSQGGTLEAGTSGEYFVHESSYSVQSLAPLNLHAFFAGHSEANSFHDFWTLHAVEINFPAGLDYEHSISIRYHDTGEVVQQFIFNSARYRGWMASVPKNWTDYEVVVDTLFLARHQEDGAWTTVFQVHNGDRIIEAAEVVPAPSPTPVQSLGVGQTPRATLSRSPSATPVALPIDGDLPIDALQTQEARHGVELAGNGSIVGTGAVEILYIANASHVQAQAVTISTYLELFADSELSATPTGTITLAPNVSLHFSSREAVTSLPKLDLGVLGDSYSTLPGELVVDIGEVPLDETVLETLKRPLVQGRTLTNCDKWVVNFQGEDASKLATTCEGEEVAPGAKLLDEHPLMTLFVVKKSEGGKPPTTPSDSKTGLIIGIVVAVVVVIAIAVVVVVVVLKKKGGDPGSDSSESLSGPEA